MSGFLFVVPPLVGHINPTVGVASRLAAHGHRVAWACADPGLVGRLAGARARVFPCAGPVPGAGEARRPPELRGPEALRFLWEWYLVPLAEAMAPGVRAAVEEFRPDVVVADQQAFAGALVAERLGLPWATSATTSAEFADPLAGLPKVTEWLAERIAHLRRAVGDPSADADPRFSPHLVLAFSTPELAGPEAAGRGGPVRWVGPSIEARPTASGFPWEWLDPGRSTVLVTLGTANADAGARFLAACREAARERADRMQAVIVDPGGVLGADGDPGSGPGPRGDADSSPGPLGDAGSGLGPRGDAGSGLGAEGAPRKGLGGDGDPQSGLGADGNPTDGLCADSNPTNGLGGNGHDKDVLVLPSVPQLALLQRAAAVVCHAGHNTVCEALWHGVPLVVAPIRDDQPVVAGQVVDAGAGLRVRFGRVSAARLGAALDSVLHEPGHRAAAGRIRTAFRAAGGASAAATHLDRLAREFR
ncbi:glycosyltransferase [Streptomyces sp. NPDC059582]|uniref:glycosyltransferase n=1 Tax=Streptomyces sp. NPDC059582 TaxID=3346875 RepID=UPI00367F5DCC